MADLTSGRHPQAEEEWLLDGSPTPPYRRTINRRDIASGSSGLGAGASNVLAVYPVPVQVGDIFNYVSLLVAVAGASLAHSWVAVYNGVTAGSALLAQVADNTTATGWAQGAQKLQLASAAANIGTEGIPQGGGSPAIVASGPAVWGVGIYQSGTTPNLFDAMPGSGAANGAVAVTGQVPMVSKTGSLGAIATAPSVLPAMTPGNGAVPYVLLSRQ